MEKTIWDMTVDEMVRSLLPNRQSTIHRQALYQIVHEAINSQLRQISDRHKIFMFGSVPLRTYLTDGDIDICIFSPDIEGEKWISLVESALLECSRKNSGVFSITDIVTVNAEVRIVKCFIGNVAVDISANQTSGIYTLNLCERVDRIVGRNHLFKRSIILIKAWMQYDAHILQSRIFLLSTYAMEIMVMYILNLYYDILFTPLQVLLKFLDEFASFDWMRFGVSYAGPIRLSKLPEIMVELEKGRNGASLIRPEVIDELKNPHAEDYPETFIQKHINIVDPLCESNNLGRSVSFQSFSRIKEAFSHYAELFRTTTLECMQIVEGSERLLREKSEVSGVLKEKAVLRIASIISKRLFPSVLARFLSPRSDESFPQPQTSRHRGAAAGQRYLHPNEQKQLGGNSYSSSAPSTPVFGTGTPHSLYSSSPSPSLSPVFTQFMLSQYQGGVQHVPHQSRAQLEGMLRAASQQMVNNGHIQHGQHQPSQVNVGSQYKGKSTNAGLAVRIGHETRQASQGIELSSQSTNADTNKPSTAKNRRVREERVPNGKAAKKIIDLTGLSNSVRDERHPLIIDNAPPAVETKEIDENSYLIAPPDQQEEILRDSSLKAKPKQPSQSPQTQSSKTKSISSHLLSSLHLTSTKSISHSNQPLSNPSAQERKEGENFIEISDVSDFNEAVAAESVEEEPEKEEMYEMKEIKNGTAIINPEASVSEIESTWDAIEEAADDSLPKMILNVEKKESGDGAEDEMRIGEESGQGEVEEVILRTFNEETLPFVSEDYSELAGDLESILETLKTVDEYKYILENHYEANYPPLGANGTTGGRRYDNRRPKRVRFP